MTAVQWWTLQTVITWFGAVPGQKLDFSMAWSLCCCLALIIYVANSFFGARGAWLQPRKRMLRGNFLLGHGRRNSKRSCHWGTDTAWGMLTVPFPLFLSIFNQAETCYFGGFVWGFFGFVVVFSPRKFRCFELDPSRKEKVSLSWWLHTMIDLTMERLWLIRWPKKMFFSSEKNLQVIHASCLTSIWNPFIYLSRTHFVILVFSWWILVLSKELSKPLGIFFPSTIIHWSFTVHWGLDSGWGYTTAGSRVSSNQLDFYCLRMGVSVFCNQAAIVFYSTSVCFYLRKKKRAIFCS